ncbi:MAG TPA: exodeoxyribonuclease VII large subunit [Halothiobacillus sp.]|nr:exodeoxyribonuclease VII large subunit [Halothiobacillus sp.]
MASSVLSVSSLNQLAKQTLEASLSGIAVAGEIRSLTRAASGHVYFTLKDTQAEVRCALFRAAALRVKADFANGDAVIVRGSVSLYTPRGDYQLIVSGVELAGDGQLAVLFEALKKKLFNEGLFDAARKRPIPALPRRIGVISSAAGAAVHDVVSTLTRRLPLAEITLFPVAVQGEAAATELTYALRSISENSDFDVILLVRGGGSMSDLWAFNDEALARAIIACPMPVISGVGHEIDFTISDFVADMRAATPTAAAELATPMPLLELMQRLQGQAGQVFRQFENRINAAGQYLDGWVHRLQNQRLILAQRHHPRLTLELRLQRAIRRQWQARRSVSQQQTSLLARFSPARWVLENRSRFERMRWRLQQVLIQRVQTQQQSLVRRQGLLRVEAVQRQIGQQRRRLLELNNRLHRAADHTQRQQAQRLTQARDVLHALSPQRVLERGYSMVETNSTLIARAQDLQSVLNHAPHFLDLTIRFADGTVPILAKKSAPIIGG